MIRNFNRRIQWDLVCRKYYISHKEMYQKLQWCEKHKQLRTRHKGLWCEWKEYGNWYLESNGRNIGGLVVLFFNERVYTEEDQQWSIVPVIYKSFLDDDKKNESVQLFEGKAQGSIAYTAVKDKFNEDNNTDFKKAFGIDKYDLRGCVPGSFHWIDQEVIKKLADNNGIIHGASGVDWCSHYPTSHCGDMPDMNTAIEVEGYVKPNKDYPFAFYPDTGNLAEYKVANSRGYILYDTHTWVNNIKYRDSICSRYSMCCHSHDIRDSKTILVKASKYTFDSVFQYFYAKRKTDPIAKLVMNAYIGNEHSAPFYENKEDEDNGIYIKNSHYTHKYAHLAAVCIARANNKMRMQLSEIELDGYHPLEVVVDGCIYQGTVEYGVKEKKLGNLEQEFTNCDVQFKYNEKDKKFLINNYIVTKKDKLVKIRHSAYNHRDDGISIDEYTGVDTMKHWNKVNQLREVMDIINPVVKDRIFC